MAGKEGSMMAYSTKRWLGAVTGVLLGLPCVASALTLHYTIGAYDDGNFSASRLYKATGCESNGYYMCGKTLLNNLTGTLTGDWDSSLNSGTLKHIHGTLSDVLEITSGQYSNKYGGSLKYTYHKANGTTLSGKFYLPAKKFAGPANSISDSALYFWGQNWKHNGTPPPHSRRFGIDLYGSQQPVPTPEPGTLLLLGTGVLGTARYAWRRRQQQAAAKVAV
jgi:hypothetical protein